MVAMNIRGTPYSGTAKTGRSRLFVISAVLYGVLLVLQMGFVIVDRC